MEANAVERPCAEPSSTPQAHITGKYCVDWKVSNEKGESRLCRAVVGKRGWGLEENDRDYQTTGLDPGSFDIS